MCQSGCIGFRTLFGIFIATVIAFQCIVCECKSAAKDFLSEAKTKTSATLPHSKVSFLSTADKLHRGDTFYAVFILEPLAGWHTYWENPGDTGLRTMLRWSVDEGVKVGATVASSPRRIVTQGSVSYGYTNKAIYFTKITLPQGYKKTDVTLKLNADWLVCKESCVPEKAELVLTLPVRESTKLSAKTASQPESAESASASKSEQEIRSLIKKHTPERIEEPLAFTRKGHTLTIIIPKTLWQERGETIAHITLIPRQELWVRYNAEQTWEHGQNTLNLYVPLSHEKDYPQTTGLILVERKDGETKAYDVTLQEQTAGVTLGTTTGREENVVVMLIFAFLGGIILNAMPCVFPILSLKVLGIVQQLETTARNKRLHSLAYTGGILISFLLVAVIVVLMKEGGTLLGWGFQMQSPLFILGMIYLIFLVGLNLSGYFDITWSAGNVGQNLTESPSFKASFFTGILAAAVATPCTAPFMATAIGYAFLASGLTIFLIMAALGLGLAFPFLLVNFIPLLGRILPRPGQWMLTFKEFLAFPLYATVVWLVWIFVEQIGAHGLFYAGSGIIVCAMIPWAHKKTRHKKHLSYWIFALVLLSSGALPFYLIGQQASRSSSLTQESERYSKQRLDTFISEKQPVLVYATAAWCLSCKINELILTSASMTKFFKENNIRLLKADWTTSDPEVTAFLDQFQRKGVPLYVFYPKERPPIVLPQILTERTVTFTLSQKEKIS